jgi:hypothetical protein
MGLMGLIGFRGSCALEDPQRAEHRPQQEIAREEHP